jgi:hypothetical protein
MNKTLTIRNSTAEFLIFTTANGQDTIEVKVSDETVWLTQKLIAKLFDVHVATINEHLKNIFNTYELEENSVIRNFLITANDGKNYNTNHYNLEVIISLGYRINSNKATEFRRWATQVLKQYATRGYVLDNERLKNGSYLNPQYYKDLILEIRDIRESERNFYQQINERHILQNAGKVTAQIAKEFAISEFEKYKVIQDKSYKSDFDRLLGEIDIQE